MLYRFKRFVADVVLYLAGVLCRNFRVNAEKRQKRCQNRVPFIYFVGDFMSFFCQRNKTVVVNAPYFNGAKLLIAADCTAYAYANMHEDFMKGKITLIGCPKLDDTDYSEKLTEIIATNDIKSMTVVRMEVPCCGGLEAAAKKALQASGKFIPWQVVTLSLDGKIKDN